MQIGKIPSDTPRIFVKCVLSVHISQKHVPVSQGSISSSVTRSHFLYWHRKTFLLVSQEEMSSCDPGRKCLLVTRRDVPLWHKKKCLLVTQEEMSSYATRSQIGAIARLKLRPVLARFREAGFVNRVNICSRADSKSQSWPIESIGPIGQIDCRAARLQCQTLVLNAIVASATILCARFEVSWSQEAKHIQPVVDGDLSPHLTVGVLT